MKKTLWKKAVYREVEHPWGYWTISEVRDSPMPELNVVCFCNEMRVVKKKSSL